MTAEELIDLYLREVVGPINLKGPKRRSLAQKQGARRAGRTRMRRQYRESKGFLHYNYYDREKYGPTDPKGRHS